MDIAMFMRKIWLFAALLFSLALAGVAEIRAAETDAVETRAAETGTAEIKAAETGAAETGDHPEGFAGIAAVFRAADQRPAGNSSEPNLKGYVESSREKEIYSYLQVPEIYSQDPVWSGEWTYIESGGQQFFYFGCGICCLSNMCSTFSGAAVPPDVMFAKACEETDYNPESGIGALSWSQLKSLTDSFGVKAAVKKKPAEYSRFQEDVRAADTVLVLVCRDNDRKLWSYTRGHYVNLWEYDPETDTVFVTDSGGRFNRARVDLADIYRALKTASEAQYMTVTAGER